MYQSKIGQSVASFPGRAGKISNKSQMLLVSFTTKPLMVASGKEVSSFVKKGNLMKQNKS